MEGTVKWFNRKKGFGFISGEDGQDYFVHHTALNQGTFIRDNDKVSFDAVETDKGKQAQKVALLQKGSEIAGAEPQSKAPKQESEEDLGDDEDSEDTEEESEEFGEEKSEN
jgi:CspA family cold shock protein